MSKAQFRDMMNTGIWTQVRNFYEETQDEVVDKLDNFDFVVTGWTSKETEPIIGKFVEECNKSDLDVHFCIICDGNELKEIDRVLDYGLNVKGFFLDYIRYENFSPLNIFRTDEITAKVKRIREYLPVNYELRAAVKSNWYFNRWFNYLFGLMWGVNYKDISEYLTAICPMVYTELYGLPQSGTHVYRATKWLDKCEPILQIYYDPTEAPMERPTWDKLQHEITLAKRGGANGVSLFRYIKDGLF